MSDRKTLKKSPEGRLYLVQDIQFLVVRLQLNEERASLPQAKHSHGRAHKAAQMTQDTVVPISVCLRGIPQLGSFIHPIGEGKPVPIQAILPCPRPHGPPLMDGLPV